MHLPKIRPAVVGFTLLFAGFGYNIYRIESAADQAAKSRVTTVSQRCELTEIFLDEAVKPGNVIKLTKSVDGCKAQLVKVEGEAGVSAK